MSRGTLRREEPLVPPWDPPPISGSASCLVLGKDTLCHRRWPHNKGRVVPRKPDDRIQRFPNIATDHNPLEQFFNIQITTYSTAIDPTVLKVITYRSLLMLMMQLVEKMELNELILSKTQEV